MISVIIPVYNEEQAVEETVRHVKRVMDSTRKTYEIIAVNDGSTDRSLEILKRMSFEKIINNPYNLGYGASIKKALVAAEHEWILILDADGTYPIQDIPKLLLYTGYDMVVGARTKNPHIPLFRIPAKKILTALARFLTGKNIPDLNSGLRLFRKGIAMKFFNLFPQGFSFTTTLTIACLTNEYTVKFVPIRYFRRKGVSSVKPFRDFKNFCMLIIRLMTYFRPMRMFGLVSADLILGAWLVFAYPFFILHKLMDISVIVLIVAALQIFLFGALAELTIRK